MKKKAQISFLAHPAWIVKGGHQARQKLFMTLKAVSGFTRTNKSGREKIKARKFLGQALYFSLEYRNQMISRFRSWLMAGNFQSLIFTDQSDGDKEKKAEELWEDFSKFTYLHKTPPGQITA